MARACKVCSHEERAVIESNLLNGDSMPSISARYGMSLSSVQRHKANCGLKWPRQHLAARGRVDAVATLLLQAGQAEKDQDNARKADAHMAVASMHGRRLALIEKIVELQGPEDVMGGSLAKHPEFAAMRDAILAALEPFPDAKSALMTALTPRTGGDSK